MGERASERSVTRMGDLGSSGQVSPTHRCGSIQPLGQRSTRKGVQPCAKSRVHRSCSRASSPPRCRSRRGSPPPLRRRPSPTPCPRSRAPASSATSSPPPEEPGRASPPTTPTSGSCAQRMASLQADRRPHEPHDQHTGQAAGLRLRVTVRATNAGGTRAVTSHSTGLVARQVRSRLRRTPPPPPPPPPPPHLDHLLFSDSFTHPDGCSPTSTPTGTRATPTRSLVRVGR